MAWTRALSLWSLAALAAYLLLERRLRGTTRGADLFGGGVVDFYMLQGGEEIAIRSLATGLYLTLSPSSGRVLASAQSPAALASRWRVLVLDKDTVAALLQSAPGWVLRTSSVEPRTHLPSRP